MPFDNPYHGVDWARGLRGNLHAHSTQSDGDAAPEAVVAAYRTLGYDFLMLSDHDLYTPEALHAQWPTHGMTMLPGCEVTQYGPHLLQVGGTRAATPVKDRQQVVDEILADGGLAIMNHPNWLHKDSEHLPQQTLAALQHYTGIEIYTGVINRLEGSAYAFDRWDRILSRGKNIWGFANDDAHRLDEIGLGWNIAFAESKSPADIITALRHGRFYSSTGVTIADIHVTGDQISITSPEADRIVAIGEWGHRLAVVDATTLTLTMPTTGYVRFECWGHGERFAWSQPIRRA